MIPDVSVVLPSYNHARFIGDCVRSILSQEGVSVEVIVCDDASSDDSLQVLAAISDPRLQVIAHRRNFGAAAAVRPGLARARGRYVARMSSDDLCLPGGFARQCAWLDAHPDTACVFCLPEFIGEDGAAIDSPTFLDGVFTAENRSGADWLRTFFEKGNCLLAPGAMMRREVLDSVPPTSALFRHLPDLETWVRLCLRHEIHVLPEKQIGFRIMDQAQNLSAPSAEKSAEAEMEKLCIWQYYTSAEALAVLGFSPPPMGRLELARWAKTVDNPSHRVFASRVLMETDLTGVDDDTSAAFLEGAMAMLRGADPLRALERKQQRQKIAKLKEKVARLEEKLTMKKSSEPRGWFRRSNDAPGGGEL